MSDETPFKFDFRKFDFNKLGITDYDAILQGAHIRLENGRDVKVLVVTDNAYICTQEDLGLGVCGWTNSNWADWVKDACRKAGVPENQGICLLYKAEVINRQHRPFPKHSLRKGLEEIR